MKKTYLSLLIVASLVLPTAAQIRYKTIDIRDLPGYKTLKCDFHIHIYSDGNVTPDVRVLEAVGEGLDAIAVTKYEPNEVVEQLLFRGTPVFLRYALQSL